MANRPTRTALGPTPADWRHLDRLRDRWNAERVGAGRAPLPDDEQTRRLLALIWRDGQDGGGGLKPATSVRARQSAARSRRAESEALAR